MRSWWVLGMAVAVVFGAALRLLALGGEFWLDEIFSSNLAREAGSHAGVFAVKHDNNHHLNTLWLTLWPAAAPWWLYRLHSVVAGLAVVVVAALVARRWGAADAVFAAFLFACSYWLVIASAEARGYSLAALFALAAFGALWKYLDRRAWGWLVAFWVTASLGFLSHLTFVHAYLGFVVWSLRRFARERARPGDELRDLAICHAGVMIFFAPFYLFCIRGMHVEGGPPGPIWPAVERLIVVGLGGEPTLGLVSLTLFVMLLVGGLIVLGQQSDVWVFFAVTVAASPALFLLLRPPFVFERYFLISFVFFLLLTAYLLGELWHRGKTPGQVIVALFLLKFVVGSGAELADFDRGRFAEALAFVLESDASAPVMVTGDDDFRARTMVEFHARYFPGRDVTYVSNKRPGQARWVIVHRLNDRDPVEDEVRDTAGNVYRLVKSYPARGPSAWGWFVYRRVGA